MRVFLISLLVLLSSNHNYAQWIPANGPYGGTVIRPIVGNGNNLYAGGTKSMYVSSNAGTNWLKINNGFTASYPMEMTFINSNIYTASWGDGIFKSTDQGHSWFHINSPFPDIYSINSIGATLFAGTDGLYGSNDGGNTWNLLLYINPPSFPVYALAVDGNAVYVGTKGIHKSTNNGNTWSQVFRDSTHWFGFLKVIGNNMFAAAGGDNGVWVSTNGGSNWLLMNNGLPSSLQPAAFTCSGNYIYVGYDYTPPWITNIVYYSNDNGLNFHPIGAGLPNRNIFSLGTFGNSLFAGTNNAGVFATTNLGTTWTAKNNGITSEITCLDVNGNQLFAGTRFGLHLSTDGGNTWSSTGLINQQSVTAVGVHNGKIFASGDSGIYISSNNGVSFTLNLRENITEFYPDGNNFFAVGRYGGVDLTTDNGLTWTALNNGIVHLNTYSLIRKGNKLFRGTLDGNYLHDYLFVSTNYGQSWSQTSLTQKNVYSLFVQGNSLIAGTNAGIFISTDDGVTWSHSVSQVPRASESLTGDVNVLFSSVDNTFNADSGICYSTDGGWNWNPLNDGLTDYNVPFLALNGNILYAGTINSSVWKRDVSSLVGVQSSGTNVPDKFALYQNYPNPFNPGTKISYDLPSNVNVKLVVYDMLGREVKTLVNEKQNAGRYEIDFNASNYPSGVYYYKLSTDNFSQTNKMVLIK